MTRIRADLLLVSRALATSRAKARAAIAAGGVRADGVPVAKPSDLIAEDAALEVIAPHPWVSRAGAKLTHALDAFGVEPAGRICLDIGASTGGFTQVLLSRGAALVYAIDVGRGQLHASLRSDRRVVSLEKQDARTLTRAHIAQSPSLIVCDVSFIGAAKALPTPLALAAPAADLIVLIKPQFEAGPHRKAVLDEAIARQIAERAMDEINGLAGFSLVASVDSPIRGREGNLERLAHFRRA